MTVWALQATREWRIALSELRQTETLTVKVRDSHYDTMTGGHAQKESIMGVRFIVYNRFFSCMEAILIFLMHLGHSERQERSLVGRFGCLKLCLFGVRELDLHL